MKLATEIRTDDFYTPNQDLQNLISEIDHQEILAIFRYYAAFNEDPQKIITGVLEAYGVNEAAGKLLNVPTIIEAEVKQND